jgi:hypothetical protein
MRSPAVKCFRDDVWEIYTAFFLPGAIAPKWRAVKHGCLVKIAILLWVVRAMLSSVFLRAKHTL